MDKASIVLDGVKYIRDASEDKDVYTMDTLLYCNKCGTRSRVGASYPREVRIDNTKVSINLCFPCSKRRPQ